METTQIEIICRSKLVVSQMMLPRDIGVLRRAAGQQWMHFGRQGWKMGQPTMALRVFAINITRLTMPHFL